MGKKDRNKAVVAIIHGVTAEEADKLTEKISKAKRKYASKGRSVIAKCPEERIGRYLQGSDRKQIE